MTDQGGDPACWLDRVCDACGAVLEDGERHDGPCPTSRSEGFRDDRDDP